MADRVSSPPNHQRQLPESAPSASVRDRKGWSGTDPGRGARSGGGSSARRNRTPKAQRRAADLDRKSLTSGSPPQHGRRAPVRRTRRKPSRGCGPGAPAETWEIGSSSHADRKSTRLNSSHTVISYAVFCLKNKKAMNLRLVCKKSY